MRTIIPALFEYVLEQSSLDTDSELLSERWFVCRVNIVSVSLF